MTPDSDSLIELIAKTRFAEEMSNSQRQCLSRVARRRTLSPGTILFREGEIEDDFFVISTGYVQLSMHVPGRGDVPFLTTGPGELVGWSGLLGEGRMTATATALEETTLIAMSGQKLRDLCSSEQDLGYILLKRVAQVLSQRLLSTRLQLLDLFAECRT